MYIQLIGRTRGGKSITAQALAVAVRQKYPEAKVKVVSFAAPLRELAADFFGHRDESLKRRPIALAGSAQTLNKLIDAVERFMHEYNVPEVLWDYLEQDLFACRTISPRRLMNIVGQAVRKIDERFFTKLAMQEQADCIIIDDTRFPNELIPNAARIVLDYNIGYVQYGIDVLFLQHTDHVPQPYELWYCSNEEEVYFNAQQYINRVGELCVK